MSSCLFLATVSGESEKGRRYWIYLRFSSLLGTAHKQEHTHKNTCTHSLSCKTTWLPAASPPASSAARDLARLIIFLLIECRGTLQGWVIKLMQRMFVSTVYLTRAKRYITHIHCMHAEAHTDSHLCARITISTTVPNNMYACKHLHSSSALHMHRHDYTDVGRMHFVQSQLICICNYKLCLNYWLFRYQNI